MAQEYALNLDCRHLHSHNVALYNKLVAYPGEMLFICDSVVQELFQRLTLTLTLILTLTLTLTRSSSSGCTPTTR